MLNLSMFVYHFVDPDLRVREGPEKEGAAKKCGFNFEIGNTSTYAHLHWRLKKISCRASLLFYYFLVTKNSFRKLS